MEIVYKKREKVVGMFLIAILILLLSTVVIIGRGQDWFKRYVVYYTSFDEGYNLQEGTAVKLSKADIGKVKKITLDNEKVKVKIAVLEEYASRIRTDSIATVESPTFLGDEYVSIKPGSKNARPLLEGDEIPSKGKMSIADLLSTYELEKTANKLMKAIQDLSDLIGIMRDSNGPLFTAFDTINGILKDLKKATEQAPAAMGQVNDNLENVKIVLKSVEENLGILKSTLTNIEKGSADVPYITQSARQEIKNLWELLDEADKIVKSLQENFLIKSNLPTESEGEAIDAGLRK